MIKRIFFLFLVLWTTVNASNWAQVSGAVLQNTVIPRLPSRAAPHWGPRYGHTVTVLPTDSFTTLGSMYLMGGDTYSNDLTSASFDPGIVDHRWEHGFKNDVWLSGGTEWYVRGDNRLRTRYHNKVPRIDSRLQWTLAEPGKHPPVGVTYDEWIACEPFFRNLPSPPDVDCSLRINVQWSPRRHHAAVFFKGYLWVLGGRAREFVQFSEDRSVGGIEGPLVKDIPTTGNNVQQRFTVQR